MKGWVRFWYNLLFSTLLQTIFTIKLYYTPFLHFSADVNSVMPFPLTPHVPMPTRPLTLSGDANILFFMIPFFEDWKMITKTVGDKIN